MKQALQVGAIIITVIGCVVIMAFLAKANSDGLSITAPTDYPTSGQFGDFIGGVVGTLFALSGTLLLFLNFREQVKENKRSAFEASFFEMIRLHRSNISELLYPNDNGSDAHPFQNRKVIREIYKEFIECYREVKRYYDSDDIRSYLRNKEIARLKRIVKDKDRKIDIIEMAIINLAFMIVYYGLSSEGEGIIKDYLRGRYNDDHYHKLLFFLRLKPKRTNNRFKIWKNIESKKHSEYHAIVNELYEARRNLKNARDLSAWAEPLVPTDDYYKYYGGHQFRLGHYFRHLYQSFNYLDSHPDLTKIEKYQYGKLYRAQLSTYEQALLFVNSISALGLRWELNAKKGTEAGPNLITEYNLIKNLPSSHSSGIKYESYYPDVDYEFQELD